MWIFDIKLRPRNFVNKEILFLLFPAFLFSCNEDTTNPTTFSQAGPSQKITEPSQIELPKVEPVDVRSLQLTNLSAVKKQIGPKEYAVSIDFEPPRYARWVKIEICSAEKGKCYKYDTVFNRVSLAGLPSGKLDISARACVEARFTKEKRESCGDVNSVSFINPSVFDAELESLYAQRLEILQTFEEFTSELTKNLKIYRKEIEKCRADQEQQFKAQKMAKLVDVFLALGEKLLDFGVKKFVKDEKAVAKNFSDKAKVSTINEEFDANSYREDIDLGVKVESFETDTNLFEAADNVDFQTSMKAFENSTSLLGEDKVPFGFAENTAKAKLLNLGNRPVNAFKFIGGSIFTLMNADKLIVPRCLAEQRFKTNNQTAMTVIRSATANLKRVDDAIERLGGSVY